MPDSPKKSSRRFYFSEAMRTVASYSEIKACVDAKIEEAKKRGVAAANIMLSCAETVAELEAHQVRRVTTFVHQ